MSIILHETSPRTVHENFSMIHLVYIHVTKFLLVLQGRKEFTVLTLSEKQKKIRNLKIYIHFTLLVPLNFLFFLFTKCNAKTHFKNNI